MSLQGKTAFITGASRGIGLAIATRLGAAGCNVAIAAKTTEPHPKLPGTIYTAAEEIEASGGKALPCIVDVRDVDQIKKAVDLTANTFGGIDILVNNASAISLTGTLHTEAKRYDLMHQINIRGTFFTSQACIPYLKKSGNAHILNLSPPLNLNPRWFSNHVAYTMSKYGMSMCVLGMAEELRESGIAVNALWPRTGIATAAIRMLMGGEEADQQCRTPEIMADAAFEILTQPSSKCTGNFFLDDEALRDFCGMTDFSKYAVVPNSNDFMPDFFIDEGFDPQGKVNSGKNTAFYAEMSKPRGPISAQPSTESAAAASQGTKSSIGLDQHFNEIRRVLNDKLVAEADAVFQFQIKGSNGKLEDWFVDCKTTNLEDRILPGIHANWTCRFKLSAEDFERSLHGKLNPQTAFFLGRMKIDGNMMAAMRLAKLLKKVQKHSK